MRHTARLKKVDELIEQSEKKIGDLYEKYQRAKEGKGDPLEAGAAFRDPLERASIDWIIEIKSLELLKIWRLKVLDEPYKNRKAWRSLIGGVVLFGLILHYLVFLEWIPSLALAYVITTFDCRLNEVTGALLKLTSYAMRLETERRMPLANLSTEEWHRRDLEFIRAAHRVWDEYLEGEAIPVARDYSQDSWYQS